MLLPGNIRPELSIYYTGGVVLKFLQQHKKQSLLDIFEIMNQEHKMSFPLLLLSLDWLYLLGVVTIGDNGVVELCT